MPINFRLVICDGPPGTVQGGRYGLLPIMGNLFEKDATILLDDANRQKEKETITKWGNERSMRPLIVDKPHGTYAILTLE